MGWSISLRRIAGTEVRIHLTFFLLIAWLGISAGARGGQVAAIDSVAFNLAVFACVLAHEYGHVLTARHFGIQTRDITLLPIGGVASIERMPEKPSEEHDRSGRSGRERGDRGRIVEAMAELRETR